MAKPTASESGRNIALAAPAMNSVGLKIARMHSIASNRGTGRLGRGVQRRAADGTAPHQVRVDVLDANRRLVHQDAHGQRQPAQSHDVDGLPGQPQGQHRAHQRKRNVDDDDQGAAPVPQKQQHHQARQHRAQRPFQRQTADGARDVGRLVELVADLHVGGQHALELRQVRLDQIDHRERGSGGALGDRDIDRAPAVDQRVAGHDVRAVHHLAHVPQEHRRETSRSESAPLPGP